MANNFLNRTDDKKHRAAPIKGGNVAATVAKPVEQSQKFKGVRKWQDMTDVKQQPRQPSPTRRPPPTVRCIPEQREHLIVDGFQIIVSATKSES